MPHKILEKTQGQVKIEITVEKDQLVKTVDLVTAELSKSVKISGFRPGKAPQLMVEKEVGKDRFWAEVIDRLVPEAYYESVVTEKLMAISQPEIQVKEFIPGERLVFEATTAILPELKDLKYKGYGLKFNKPSITDQDKKEAFDGLLEKYATEKEVTRESKKGDRVEIDFEGTMKGLPFDGGKSQNHPLVIGSNVMIPGFEDNLIGKKPGDEFDFEISFPKDYQAKNLAGQKVNFKVKMNKIYESEKAVADDEFAKKFGLKDLTELKAELEKELIFQKELAEKQKLENQIIEKIVKDNKVEAPEILVKEEIHRMVHEAEHNLSHSGLTLEQFLEMSKKTLEDLHKEMEPEAKRRVTFGIVIGEITRAENLKVEETEIGAEVEKILATATPGVNPDDLKAAYDSPDQRREMGNNMLIRKAIDRLWELNVAK
jgi:trigger factor